MTFNDLLDKLTQRKLNLVTAQELTQWLTDNLKVKNYIPLAQKYSVAGTIKRAYQQSLPEDPDDFNIQFANLRYDIISTFYILLSYVDVPVDEDKLTIDSYDLLISSGFYNYIMCYAGSDYNDFVAKCERLTGIRDLEITHEFMIQLGQKLDVSNFEQMRKEINKIDMRKLGLLESVAKLNDPLTAEVAATLRTTAHEKIKEESKKRAESNIGDKKE